MEENRFIETTIFGEKYKLLSTIENQGKLLKIIAFVNEKIESLHEKFPKYSKEKIAILTSLNLADELFNQTRAQETAKEEQVKVEKKIQEIIDLFSHTENLSIKK